MRDLLLSDIISYFDDDIIEIKGVITGKIIKYIKPIGNEDEYSLDWINPTNENGQSFAEQTKAKAIICNNSIDYSDVLQHEYKVLIVAENPKLLLAKIYQKYFKLLPKPMISNKADISSDAVIGNNCYIGPFCSIGKCRIGDNVTIMPNVTIYDDVEIGNNVIVHSGTVLGRPGFGYENDNNGVFYQFPQVAKLIINDNVEIGANCTIDKGALKNTVIGQNTKINNGCHIAHNVSIGKSTIITGHVYVAGSTNIGNNDWISPNTTLIGHTNVGSNSKIGAGSLVTKDIPNNELWFGSPAKKMRDNEK